jgi:hypothetical protein
MNGQRNTRYKWLWRQYSSVTSHARHAFVTDNHEIAQPASGSGVGIRVLARLSIAEASRTITNVRAFGLRVRNLGGGHHE